MRGKYKNWLIYELALLRREHLREKPSQLIQWEPLHHPQDGCTAIVGMCSRLPDILFVNIRCLAKFRWAELKHVLIAVDCTEDSFQHRIESQVIAEHPELDIRFLYYSPAQSAMADSCNLPFVYSWLSWCIALKHTTTAHVLIHDYDALVLGPALEERYKIFADSPAKVQGIAWYQSNGVEVADRLATTFEAFVDAQWLRASPPLSLFNKIRVIGGRSIDFDTTLDLQYRLLTAEQRTIVPMGQDDLVHPSQMIHQYTMFRRFPAARLPCFSVPMIPFFTYLGGRTEAIDHATRALSAGACRDLDLLNDGTRINLSKLDIPQVDWLLKQIVQACLALLPEPDHRIYEYGLALYRAIGTPAEQVWRGDFTLPQRRWIQAARSHTDLESNSQQACNGLSISTRRSRPSGE